MQSKGARDPGDTKILRTQYVGTRPRDINTLCHETSVKMTVSSLQSIAQCLLIATFYLRKIRLYIIVYLRDKPKDYICLFFGRHNNPSSDIQFPFKPSGCTECQLNICHVESISSEFIEALSLKMTFKS